MGELLGVIEVEFSASQNFCLQLVFEPVYFHYLGFELCVTSDVLLIDAIQNCLHGEPVVLDDVVDLEGEGRYLGSQTVLFLRDQSLEPLDIALLESHHLDTQGRKQLHFLQRVSQEL